MHQRTLEETRTLRMINKMYEAKHSGGATLLVYSEEILANGDPKLNYFAAQILGVNFAEHLEKVLEANVLHWYHMGLELCIDMKQLDNATKYSFVVRFYEKILQHDNLYVLYKTTEAMENEGIFSEYLSSKPNSQYYKKLYAEKIRSLPSAFDVMLRKTR